MPFLDPSDESTSEFPTDSESELEQPPTPKHLRLHLNKTKVKLRDSFYRKLGLDDLRRLAFLQRARKINNQNVKKMFSKNKAPQQVSLSPSPTTSIAVMPSSNNSPTTTRRRSSLLAFNPIAFSIYLHLTFQLLTLMIVLFFLHTLYHDVYLKLNHKSSLILAQIEDCSHSYVRNKCHPSQRVPAAEAACIKWEYCMNQNPSVGKLGVLAETFAEVVNGFVTPLSWKSWGVVIIIGGITLNWGVFGRYNSSDDDTRPRTRSRPKTIKN